MADQPAAMKLSVGHKLLISIFKGVNRLVAWHKLPNFLSIPNLLAFRYELRANNLYDVYPSPDYHGKLGDPVMENQEYHTTRNSDGLFNSLEQPRMGCAGMRFGRNVPRKHAKAPTPEELMTPNPRVVSETLLARHKFQPATIVNLLAAAWIQFNVHDWMMHTNSKTETIKVPLPEGDTWSGSEMKMPRTVADEVLDAADEESPGHKNENTHWWDGSQIYGSSEEMTRKLRGISPDGKLTVDKDQCETFLPRDDKGIPMTGFRSNWWIGLELLHTLFVLEHNTICDELRQHNPDWTSERIFDTARLINCALMAKIHTIEWTPAILAHPALQAGMSANWWGLLGEKLYKMLGRVSKGEILSGIPGSGADQDNVPYCLTEEFVSVYRLHSLIPDNIAFFNVDSGQHKQNLDMHNVAFENARKPFQECGLSFADVFYSFGINFPGAITLNNMPNFLRDIHTPDGEHLDMGVVDILRDRERGIPRYNQFRRLFHMKPAKDFMELTGGNEELSAKISGVYEGDIEKVDLLVGCLSEPLPKGFGFSDTAFRVFILMATRRLKSDRFIATQFNAEIYTKEGLGWVQNSTMRDVLCRHFPELGPTLKDSKNAFAPWTKVGTSAEYKGEETNA